MGVGVHGGEDGGVNRRVHGLNGGEAGEVRLEVRTGCEWKFSGCENGGTNVV